MRRNIKKTAKELAMRSNLVDIDVKLIHERKGHGMIKVGDKVQKVSGYRWPGVVIMVGTTLTGKTRIVVECTVPEVTGALHIYSPEQLKKVK